MLNHIDLAPRTARASHLWEMPLWLLGREEEGAACSSEMLCFQSAQIKGDEPARVSHRFGLKPSTRLGLREMQRLDKIQGPA